MPVSAVNGAAAVTIANVGSNDVADESRPNVGWSNMMRASDGTLDVLRLERFRATIASDTAVTATTTTITTTTTTTTTTRKRTAVGNNGNTATSRKCEGQQMGLVNSTNSCSSCVSGNRMTTEMAQEEHGPSWNNLPSVILQEIFSYLPHESRITASQVCRNWRYTLFHPSFWKKIVFAFRDKDSILWIRYLAERFALSVQEATIRWKAPSNINYVGEMYRLLNKLSQNRQLKKLFLEFDDKTYAFDNDSNYYRPTSLVKSVINIIKTSNCLEALSLGCTEEPVENIYVILEHLRLHHAKHLTHLSLASIKNNPDYYKVYNIDSSCFNSFIRLSVLTLDYEFVSDTLLKALDNGCMQRLVIHIHGWKKTYPGTTNRAWQTFVQKNPQCELRLNLIHSYTGVKALHSDIFCPAMPLTHLKVLFCRNVNIRALFRLSMWYSHTLKSLTWIDSIDRTQHMPATLDPNDPNSPDPLVLVAWKCSKLTKMVFLGYKYYQENLLAIARLRGSTLKLLAFAKSDITSDHLWHKAENIAHEIGNIMGLHWMPLNDSDLPLVILNPLKGSSRKVIMSLVLSDQK